MPKFRVHGENSIRRVDEWADKGQLELGVLDLQEIVWVDSVGRTLKYGKLVTQGNILKEQS